MKRAACLSIISLLAQAEPVTAQSVPEEKADSYKCRGADGYAADFDGHRTFLWRPEWLKAIAADAKSSKARVAEAKMALKRGPYSVTDKRRLVPGATKHDYTSIGPYWWPNAGKSDGLPYKRRDGEVNPERGGPDFDKDRLSKLGADIEALALGYFLTDDTRYADHAAALVRTWFLDPATRMAPNMNFAQGIPGRVDGRGEGIIEASDLSTVVESVGLISPSGALSDVEIAALKQWFTQFATWLATSENGTAEMKKANNHGVFYDFYLAHFALFAGMESVTNSLATNFPEYRLARQMDKQGRFIAELKRTRSWHYSNYVVAGAARLATIAECVDQDLWEAQLEDGRSLTSAARFLDKYSDHPQTWPFPDRDHEAAQYDRMARSHNRVKLLFSRSDPYVGSFELP